ncbi:unnamed protein product [Tuber aestivum]|uniref:RecQ-mediated genome instability protein 1 n=1 Tax=Tuber aestivum TaxID=59557 RepID=A0A292PLA1_9PEZI|nr:unnamed protein product [Tuber aestivum]
MPLPPIDTILKHFSANHALHIRPTYLQTLLTSLASQRQIPTGPALFGWLKFRILSSDITDSLQPYANLCFPVNITDGDVQSTPLPGPVAVQVVGIEDMGTSKFNQIDRIEMGERGEFMKGKEVIRVVPEEEGDEGVSGGALGRPRVATAKTGPHKLLVEDAGGRGVYGIELHDIQGVHVDMPMGTKQMVLKNVTVCRGVLLLAPANTLVLGGKVETLNQQYLANRKQVLKAALEKLRPQS